MTRSAVALIVAVGATSGLAAATSEPGRAPTASAPSDESGTGDPRGHLLVVAPDDETPTPTTFPDDFIPEQRNLSDCVGLVEKPGCGSDARGGWRQTAVFVLLALGLAFVFWRIAAGVRSRRPTDDGDASAHPRDDGATYRPGT